MLAWHPRPAVNVYRVCNSCGKELAYYRHLYDKTGIVCPGKEECLLDRDNVSVISSESSVMSFTFARLEYYF